MADDPVEGGFAAAIEEAQKLPKGGPATLADVSSPFPLPVPKGHRVVSGDMPGKVPGAVEHDYEHHTKVLNLCDATDRDEYDRIMNQCLSGEAIPRKETETFTKDGDLLVAVRWMTYKPKPAKKKADEEDEDEEGQKGR